VPEDGDRDGGDEPGVEPLRHAERRGVPAAPGTASASGIDRPGSWSAAPGAGSAAGPAASWRCSKRRAEREERPHDRQQAEDDPHPDDRDGQAEAEVLHRSA